jgi:hypothetical protein
MLEQETEIIIETLRGRTIGSAGTLSLRQALASDIPRCVKTYLHAETISRLADDLKASPHFARVDMAAPGADRLTRSFLLSLAEGYLFERDAFLSLLENAVLFLENYLCRPQWTIENFVFESAERIPLPALLIKLEHTSDYSYFKTLVERIARRRHWTDIGRADLRTMLAAIDDRIVKEHNARELALLAKPLFDFILLRDTPPDVPIPLKPVLVFFEDKKMKILREYIEDICRIRGRDNITLDELTTLVEDLYLGHGGAPPLPFGPAGTDVLPVSADAAPRPLETPPPPDPAPALESPVMPESTGTSDGSHDEDHPDGDQPATSARIVLPGNHALSLTFAGMSGEPPAPALPPLRGLIDRHARARFVRRLFGRDEDRFEEVLKRLEEIATWKEASLYLLELYQTIDLDPFDADMVEFTDTIHRRYAGMDLE